MAVTLVSCQENSNPQRMTTHSLESKDTVERAYAIRDLQNAKEASDEELDLAAKYLSDDSKFGCVIVQELGPTAKNFQGTVFRGREVRYLKDVYTTDIENSYNKREIRQLAQDALKAHQPAGAEAAIRRLPNEPNRETRQLLLDIVHHGYRTVKGCRSPAGARELIRIIEDKDEHVFVRSRALSSLLLLEDPEVMNWLLNDCGGHLKDYRFREVALQLSDNLKPIVIGRPIEMLAVFDPPGKHIDNYVYDVFKSEISSGHFSPGDVKKILEKLFDKKYYSAPELMVAVIRRCHNSELKALARDLLLKWDHSKGVKFLINEHRNALMREDTYLSEALETAMRELDSPHVRAYFESLEKTGKR